MSHGPTNYPTLGFCIYCRCEGVRLTDEHIVPYSLGGAHILKGASCDACAKITSRFELKISRGLWGQARLSYGANSRRKKKQKKIQILFDGENSGRYQWVQNQEVPAVFVFYEMPPAGILSGLDSATDMSQHWTLKAISDTDRYEKFEARYKFKPAVSFAHQPKEFGQLLLKIGYGQALTCLQIDDFEAICLPYILGSSSNVSWLVGTNFGSSAPLNDIGYSLGLQVAGTLDHLYIIAEIKLWANTHMPWYHAVVGSVNGRDKVRRVIEKIIKINELGQS